ncbi:hypothetical protein SPRG_00239 [Saprolegnia parasitica CBS 223.65]|uniref:ABC transporter domain-containing protein n=1 Tax=Saprolegnia parasitica (strain CBS 223.65) TaxID=695850 RepID=A0A067CXF2_SAPPC|nr:hypothetical protein SPRG_00239 [Saprolegnia parasitica CBS 223.65]KDO35389.1 hypothetical protein SPRG_00239 [Saprolegnia parasitica CBS 223.65]|eukprot:XP_012193732.1 hypothetical protein SPRG_00239 [Saprolegnia parasitica CBS 223.65]
MTTSGLAIHLADVAVSAPLPLWSRVKAVLGDGSLARRQILHSMSGSFAPGSMTLLLGQPGAGKSSLLKLLSGRLTRMRIDGRITYNGVPMPDAAARAAYVGQRDDHDESLTVNETLAFAAACGRAPMDTAAVVHALGLGTCADTTIRELSGGERKRVTFGEMAFGDAPIVCLDEISTGLDSATTHRLVSLLKDVATASGKTVVVALLQPTPPVVNLFDSVLLLHCGHVLYHGPVVDCSAYFASIGLVCPLERDVADFLLDLGAPQMAAYCSGPNVPRDSASLASAFRASPLYTPSEPVVMASVAPLPPSTVVSPYRALLMRQLRIFFRNTSFVHSRLVTVMVMGLMYATTFYNVDPATPATLLGVVFSTSIFLALGQIATLPSLLLGRSTYYKHTRSRFFSPFAFVVAQSLAPVPFALVETLICGSLVYWFAGFAASASAFGLFILLLLLTNLTFGAWFGLIGAISPSMYIADPMALLTILVTVVFAGFVVPLQSLPPFLRWIYWLNPLAWCNRAITISEYMAAKYARCEHQGIDYCHATGATSFGHAQLQTLGLPHDAAWVGYGVVFLLGSYVAYVGATMLALTYVEYNDGQAHHVAVVRTTSTTTGDYTEAPMHERIDIHEPLQAAPPQTLMTLAFQDISYATRDGVQLLTNVSGYAQPGTITALMGPSGAGKTTLLDVLAGRKTAGTTTGCITVNGVPTQSVARYAGYCEQDDVHCEATTFREALHFSALLRQPSHVPTSAKIAFADMCLALLDMHSLADKLVRGSSVEQMKRLTIGVELAASPTILFLDEPTSGLDARSAKIVMESVRHVASTGRTVVCTIHQPSTEVFALFDALLLLQRGGTTAFFGPLGPKSAHLLSYFEAWHKAPPQDVNPATWMLDVLADDRIDYADRFLKSKEHDALMSALASTGVSDLSAPSAGAPLVTQCYLLTTRFFRVYWRTPESLRTRLYIAMGLALLFGLVFADVRYETYTGATAAVGMVYITTTYMGYISFNSAIPLASEARRSYYRERAASTYAPLAYFVGSTLVEVPYAMATALLFTVIFAPLVGIATAAIGLYTVYVCLLLLLYVYMGQLMVYLLPTPETSILLGILLNSIFFLFYGFVPPSSQIPSWYQWLYISTPPQYGMALLAAEAFGQCTSRNSVGCGVVHDAPLALRRAIGVDAPMVRDYVAFVYKMRIDDQTRNLVVTVLSILGVRLLALGALQFVQYRKR